MCRVASIAAGPHSPALLRDVLAARARVHVLREEGVLGHLAVTGGVVEEEEALAAGVEDLEDGNGVVELRVHVVAAPAARGWMSDAWALPMNMHTLASRWPSSCLPCAASQ